MTAFLPPPPPGAAPSRATFVFPKKTTFCCAKTNLLMSNTTKTVSVKLPLDQADRWSQLAAASDLLQKDLFQRMMDLHEHGAAPDPSVAGRLEQLQAQNQELLMRLESQPEPAPEGAVVIPLEPAEQYLLQEVCARESRRTGEPVTPGDLLLQMFLSYLVKGTHDHFPRPWSVGQLREIHAKYQGA